jgi:transcriptional regulator
MNLMKYRHEVVEFMNRFSFGVIITSKKEQPTATHLPFIVSLRDDKIILTSHFAKANKQWKDILEHQVLVIFSEPHAYISPTLYEKELNVPTWNYMAVHAYGKGVIMGDVQKIREVMEVTIRTYEESYVEQWNRLPEDYKINMMNGVVAFEIEVSEVYGKKKLSQNKTETEKKNIIEALSDSSDTNAQLIAEYMRK